VQASKLLRTMVCCADFIAIATGTSELISSSTAIWWTMTKACASAWLLLSHSENFWKDAGHYITRKQKLRPYLRKVM